MKLIRMKYKLGLFVLTFLCSSLMYAQEQELTFKEAVEIALRENVNIKSQYNQLEIIHAQRLNRRAQYLHNVSINGSGSRTDGQQINNQTGVGENITSDFFRAGIGANIPLFNG